jgi:ribokinase
VAGRVCVVGSANLDLVARVTRLPRSGETVSGHDFFEAPGGKGLNQAVAAARAGASVCFVGALGDDAAGSALRQVMLDEHVDISGVTTVEAPTGRALIGVADDGANLIIVVPGANAHVDATVVEGARASVGSAEVVLLQHEIPMEAVRRSLLIAREGGATTILNPAPARVVPPDVLGLVDLLIPNEHEYALLGDVTSVPTVVVTEGEAGSRVIHAGGQRRIAPFPVNAVDTVAAGDAFCGALAAALAAGLDLDAALVRASAAGALATTRSGAVPSMPTAAEIDALVAGR